MSRQQRPADKDGAKRSRPGSKLNGDSTPSRSTFAGPRAELSAAIEHFRARVLQDALAEATAAYWNRRAETFAAVGNARCDEIALACRRHATLVPLDDAELVAGALGEVA